MIIISPQKENQIHASTRDKQYIVKQTSPVVLARHLLCTWLELATLMFWEPISDLVISISSFVVFILLSVLYEITLFRSFRLKCQWLLSLVYRLYWNKKVDWLKQLIITQTKILHLLEGPAYMLTRLLKTNQD